MDPIEALRGYIKEVLDGFSGQMLPNSGRGNMRYDVATRSNDGMHSWEETPTTIENDDEEHSDCSSCGAECGCNIDCDRCMLEWMTEAGDPEGPKDGKPTKLAACVLVASDDGKYLAVSRRTDPTAFGLPGGKVDPGETPAEAAARELHEETGLKATNLRHVFTRHDTDSTCFTFIADITGDINTDESGAIAWVTPDVLYAGPFGEYNRRLFSALGLQ